jgi:hypothetical protein
MRLCDAIERTAGQKAVSPEGVCGGTFDWLIATVPDPDRTNLQLMFDRSVESILRAAEDEGYSFDRHWLPWQVGADTLNTSIANDPGILFFRPGTRSKPLVVLLVGETPTSGINVLQFENARKFVSGNPQKARIAGPSFSGSFSSLMQVTRDNPENYRVVTGSATNAASRETFRSQVRDFHATVHTDDTLFRALFHFIEEAWERPQAVAILAEQDTAYGQQFGARAQLTDTLRQPSMQMHVFRYPRNISRLRNAYRDPNSPLPADPSADPGQSAVFGFKDPENPADTLPQFAPVHTPASQEAILSLIASTLSREKIRYAVVTATNTLDLLFISRYLREACPDVRLLISEGDLLFSHGAEAYSYGGIVSVSTYPLMPANQHWSSRSGLSTSLTSFSDGFSQGVYNAVRILLHPQGRPDLPSYASPFTPGGVPPVWVTAVGAAGYFPIAALNPLQDPALYREDADPGSDWGFFVERPPVLWIALFTAAIMISWGVILICRLAGPSTGIFAGLYREQHYNGLHLGRSFYRLCLHLALIGLVGVFTYPVTILFAKAAYSDLAQAFAAALLLPVVIGAVAARPALEPAQAARRRPNRNLILTIAIAAAAVVFVLLGNVRSDDERYPVWAAWCTSLGVTTVAALLWSGIHPLLPALRRESLAGKQLRRSLRCTYGFHFMLVGVVVLATVICAVRTLFAPGHEALFIAYRSLVLASGVSPVPTTMLLLIGLTVWSLAQVRRILLADQRCPILSDLSNNSLMRRLNHVRAELERVIARPSQSAAVATLLATVIAAAIVAPFIGDHQTLEPSSCEQFLVILFLVSSTLNIFAWMGLLQVWATFRCFLRLLDGHPVRTAFDSVKICYRWAPIWQIRGIGREDVVLTRSIEALRQIASRLPQDFTADQVRHALETVQSASDRMNEEAAAGRPACPRDMRHIQCELALAGSALARVMDPYWSRGMTPRTLDDKTLKPTHPEYLASLVQHFLGLRFLAYITYVQSQMQMLLASTVALFVTSLFALNLYPFLSQEKLGWIWMVFFLAYVIAIGVVFAQMAKDPVFSRLTGRDAGRLDWDFARRMLAWGALPLASVIASNSHSMARWLYRWIVPTIEAIR